MERSGWIAAEFGKSESNRDAKYYTLTRAGRRQLQDETAEWGRITHAMALALRTT
jgi:DNA-binding PadR family transcriptional regulator